MKKSRVCNWIPVKKLSQLQFLAVRNLMITNDKYFYICIGLIIITCYGVPSTGRYLPQISRQHKSTMLEQ